MVAKTDKARNSIVLILLRNMRAHSKQDVEGTKNMPSL